MTKTRLRLPAFISEGMIIQQNQPFMLRGEAKPNASVSVTFTKNPADISRPVSPLDLEYGILFEAETLADESGAFQVELPALAASFDPLSLCVTSGKNQIDVTDILVGEVWIAIGADNMAFPVRAAANSKQLLEQANTPYIRFLYPDPKVNDDTPIDPAADFAGGKWIYGDDHAAVADRSAIAFTFARELCQEIHQPVAIIDLAVRNARLHALLPRTMVLANDRLHTHVESLHYYRDESNWNLLGDLNMHQPGALYNSRIAPLHGLSVQGILWLHGESDFDQPTFYAEGFSSLIDDFQQLFRPANSSGLNLIYAQLPPFYTALNKDRYLARFNEMLASLRLTLHCTAGLITTYDLPLEYQEAPAPFNQPKTPWTKQPIGHRMKLAACGLVYQRKAPDSAPECAEYELVGNKLLISFSHIGDGLRLIGEDSRLRGFAICGQDRVFVAASARLLYGVRVLVWSDQIAEPIAVSYADHDLNMNANLVSRDGLPVVPFRSDRVASRLADDLEWLHCERLKTWAVLGSDLAEGPGYHPVYQLTQGTGVIQIERINKNEGDGSLHLRYETDGQKQVAIGPILSYPSCYPPLDLSIFSGLSIDLFNPDQQFKNLTIVLHIDPIADETGSSDGTAETSVNNDSSGRIVLESFPIEPVLRWQTLRFELGSVQADRRAVRDISFIISDRKGKGQIFIDNICPLLPE